MAFWKKVVNITVFLNSCGLRNPEAISCFQATHLLEALASDKSIFVTDLAGICVLSPSEHIDISRNVSCVFKETNVTKSCFFVLGQDTPCVCLSVYPSIHPLLLNTENGRSPCQKASQAMSATDAECTAVLGAVAGDELGVSAVAGHVSIFKRSNRSLLQAPENPKSEFQSIFPSLSNTDISFSFLLRMKGLASKPLY